jgi:zinc/manganese transport system ATP-binding protein
MSAKVTLQNLTVSYERHPAVHHINGVFESGSLTAIAGPNGAGKSTLLKAVAGLIKPDEGNIRIEGIPKDNIAYLPQAAAIQRDFPITVMHLISTGFWRQSGGWGTITREMQEQASNALCVVGLSGFEKRNLQSLSLGQFQRALFARLLLQNGSLILLDEPFTAIDADSTRHLLDIITQWHAEKRTIICVLHDFDQIRKYFPQCLLMARECVAWGPSAETLNPEYLLKARFFHEMPGNAVELCKQVI